MDISTFDFSLYGLCFLGSALLIFVLLRKAVFHVFDPWIFILINQTLTITYSAYAYLQGDLRQEHFFYIMLSLVAFAIGLNLLSGKNRTPSSFYLIFTSRTIRTAIVFLVAYQGLLDIIFVLARGLPILYPDGPNPTMYAGGFGIVKFVHNGTATLLPLLSFQALHLYRNRRLFLIGISAVAYPALLMEQGKTGLIGLLFVYVAFIYYYNQIMRARARIPTNLLLVLTAIGSLYVGYRFSAVSEAGYEDTALLAVIKRLINSADAVHMYFVLGANEKFEGALSIFSLYTSLISPYFGYKDEIAQNFAVLLSGYAFGGGTPGYGASSPMQVIGYAAYGYYGCVYCFVVGVVLSIVKFTNVFKHNLVLFLIVYGVITTATADAAQLLYYLSNLIFLIPPLLCAFLVADYGYFRSVFTFRRLNNVSGETSLAKSELMGEKARATWA